MRCAIYTRVSTDEQARLEYSSLETQADICRSYVDVHRDDGWAVTAVYEDAGLSGKDLHRPAIQRLLKDVRSGQVDVVIAYKLDRVSRSLRDFYEFWGVIQQAGATFVSATQSFDTSAPAGNLMLNMLLSFAQFERETTAERTSAKMKARAARGLWNGGFIPYGYDYDRQSQLLIPHPDEADVLRRIFSSLISTGSLARVCDGLAADGILTRTRVIMTRSGEPRQVGGRRFRPDTLKSVIQNPLYMGLIRCQGEDYPGKHEALVSQDLWDRANAVLMSSSMKRNNSPDRDEHCHLLKSLIHCQDCGSTMTPHPSGKVGRDGQHFLYYACTAVVREPKRCRCRVRRLPVRRFEAAVTRLLEEIAQDDEVLIALAEHARHHVGDELPRLHRERDERRSRLELLAKQSTRMIELFKTRKRVPRSVIEEFERMEDETEAVRGEIGELEDRIGELEAGAPDADALRVLLKPFIGGMEDMSLEERKTVLQSVIGGITVNRTEPSPSADGEEQRPGGLRIRTRRLSVNIHLKRRTPESGDSGASAGVRVNRTGSGSDLGWIGSARSSRIRVSATVSAWGDLDASRWSEGFELHVGEPPDEVTGEVRDGVEVPRASRSESVEDRARRFMSMLASGQVASRAELARRIGVSRSYITKVLRRVPVAG